MAINAAWHQAHPMPPRATERRRAEWHLAHAQECACKPIPPRLAERMREWGMLPASE